MNSTELTKIITSVKQNSVLYVRKNIFMKPLKVCDITQNYIDGLNDDQVKRFLVAPRKTKQTMETVTEFVQMNEKNDRHILFGIYYKNILRGTARLHDINENEKTAYVGIALFDKTIWGKGIASECLRCLVDDISELFEIKTVYAGIEELNSGSKSAFRKAGFRLAPGTLAVKNGAQSNLWAWQKTP